jgi:hypothetical protein
MASFSLLASLLLLDPERGDSTGLVFSELVAEISVGEYSGTYGVGVDYPYGEDQSSWGTDCAGKAADESGAWYIVDVPDGFYVAKIRWGYTPWTDASYVRWDAPASPWANVLVATDADQNTEMMTSAEYLANGTHSLWIGSASHQSTKWTVPWCGTIEIMSTATTATFTESSTTRTTFSSTTTETTSTSRTTTTDSTTKTTTVTFTMTSTPSASLSSTNTESSTTTSVTASSGEWKVAGVAGADTASFSALLLATGGICLLFLLLACVIVWARGRDEVAPLAAKYAESEDPDSQTIVGGMTLNNVSYPVVAGRPSLKSAFEKACAKAIAENAGLPVGNVEVTLSSGSVKVAYKLKKVSSSSSEDVRRSIDSDQMAKGVVRALVKVRGINAAKSKSGEICVTDVWGPDVAVQEARVDKLNPVIQGLDVEVTLDPEAYERECILCSLTWPYMLDGTPRYEKRGLKGSIDEIDFSDKTVRLSGGIDWVPIRALVGFETWNPMQECVHVHGASGDYADVINGTYALALHLGYHVWRKEDDHTKWLARFADGNGLWYLTSTDRLLSNQVGGWMESTRAESDPGRAEPWKVWTGLAWELQGALSVDRFRSPAGCAAPPGSLPAPALLSPASGLSVMSGLGSPMTSGLGLGSPRWRLAEEADGRYPGLYPVMPYPVDVDPRYGYESALGRPRLA